MVTKRRTNTDLKNGRKLDSLQDVFNRKRILNKLKKAGLVKKKKKIICF